ncbi:predicted transporter component [Acetobacter aceti NRIC 0242]|uniref:Membrane protein n=2 Tax=Acetobacter aceti TaxID=435 RepID=A0A6S6PE58_ACEAC|nr:YeeE/YedE thiosulfate transporter family protein [Acetobacter aceti]GBO81908.1 predicted transporter component [Acetobacter aceti NRIC 0242]TCS33014.1 hypothetical protein EDC15_10984 [Acetobacter aceti NBRC 14818]BCI65569.1 membrane protein [Acetobacter aceti]BCK76441.1 membrane protein [Acetobacter aceti NBRC 14818]GAN56183.1 hypothetical protein Abac_003_082 [Acetobacter aceti NBRC 14818]
MTSSYLQSFLGGILIGLGASALLLLNGRIAGVSGILAGFLVGHRRVACGAFLAGLIVAPLVYTLLTDHWPKMHFQVPWFVFFPAGILAGYGARLGGGCTSGHGILGLGRLSPRSFVAVPVFLLSGMITVAILRLTLWK